MTELQKKSCHTLELHKVLELLEKEAVSPRAKEMARALEPEDNLVGCERLQQQTEDAAYGRCPPDWNGPRWAAA